MSKRPTTGGSFLSRLRWPTSRLRDMPIWSKLGLIMIVPTIATIVVGTSGVIDYLETLDDANRAGDLANLTDYSGELVDSLQDERALAVLLLGANEQTREQYTRAYEEAHGRVDRARGPYADQRAALDDLPATFDRLLDRVDQNLADLPDTRTEIFDNRLPLTDAARSYEGLINDLLDIRDSASQLAGDTDLSERMRAVAATARAKEYLSVRRVVVHRALIQGSMNPVLRTDYIATGTGQQQALQSFQAVANQSESELYQQTVAGSDQRQLENYLGWINGNTTESMAGAPFGANEWDASTVANAALIRTVEAKLDDEVVRLADRIRADVQQRVLVETGLLLGMLVLAIFFAYLVARSMARSLRDLRQGALSIAQHGLPHAVARLRDPQASAALTPMELANQIAEPLPVRSRDEFGQVTEAFNAVHLEAVRTAAEQAALRASVATMFVNLARRSQILVDRLIGHLDRLERGEEDPDRLAELFQLDHLATRMRRNDENLLVLAGADSTRVQRQPAALIDVLRAAQSEVEHYTRVEFGVIDRDIEVAAHAVNDLVHLVAELFDNATAFSPPESQVMVEARRVGDRACLYVEDQGIGISPEQRAELNERLATPPQVDVAVSRMMGLVVVARLAARHGVRVELRPGTDRGTVAEVTLPTSVLVPRTLAGRGSPPSALPGGGLASSAPEATLGALPASGGAPPLPRSGGSGNQLTLGGRPVEPAPRNGSRASLTGAGRPLPAWSDLTGADAGTGGGESVPPAAPPSVPSADALPSRPVPSAPAPPVWPPVAGGDRDVPAPPVPERLAAALDMTAELPRVPRAGAEPPAGRPPARTSAVPPPQSRQRYADETMELPIFRELESAWFRTRRPANDATATAASTAPVDTPDARTQQFAAVDPARPAAQHTPTGTTGNAAMVRNSPMTGDTPRDGAATSGAGSTYPDGYLRRRQSQPGGWQTAADEGWRAASAASRVPVAETTQTGLPKRVPMAQLVPGGVEKPAASVQRRTPESVRGLLSAYHRGVQRGRSNPADSHSSGPETTPGGKQSSQSGSGPTAGSGQKEQEG